MSAIRFPFDMMRRYREPEVLAKCALVTLAYVVTGWLGLKIPYSGSHITLVWLPSGIATAAMLQCGWTAWPGVYVGAVLVNLLVDSSLPLAAGIAVGNTFGPLLVAYWLNRAGFHRDIDRRVDVAMLVAAATLGMMVSASGGVASLALAGLMAPTAAAIAWLTWWMGDICGVLLAAPVVLTLTRKNIRQLGNIKELPPWLLAASVVAWFVFIQDYREFGHTLPLAFLTLPLLAWAALRFGVFGAALAALAFSMVAAVGTASGRGTFFLPDEHASLVLLWCYMATAVMMALLIAVMQAEQRRAEDAHRAEAEKLRGLFTLSPLGIALTDMNGRYVEFNQAFERICGYTRVELAELDYWRLTPKEYAAQEAAQLESLNKTGAYGPYEKEYVRKDGSRIPLALNGVLIRGRDGAPYIWSIVEDITERKRAGEAAAASEARFRQLADAAFEGVAISENGVLIDANPQFCRLLGYELAEVVGRAVIDFVALEHRFKVAERIRTSDNSPFEHSLLRRDGSTVQVLAHGRSLVRNGKLLRVTALFDITEMRRTEAQLRTLSRAVEQCPASIVITDREGRIEYVNPHFEAVTGYSPGEAIGKNPRILKSGKVDAKTYEALWHTISAGGEWRGELCNRRKNGELFWEHAAISGLQGEDGRITHYVAVKEDITERKRFEELRMQSQKMESLGTLAGGIAHDFNNILTAIRGNADLAAANLDGEHPATVSLAEIRKAGSRASALVRRILAFGQRQSPKREVTCLSEVVNEVLKLLRSTLPAGIALKTRFVPDAPRVFADTALVHEALVNLTTNAAYAIGARTGSIEYALEKAQLDAVQGRNLDLPPGLYARLSVRDSGCGMDEATKARIFDAFYTTKPLGEGTGLGLSMVYGIMQGHDGAVLVDSAPGQGASFHLYFPASTAAEVPAALPVARTIPRVNGMRVLYVDDEEALVFLATRALAQFGHDVRGFIDPRSALEAFRSQAQNFDVVVTDLSMPEMSGFDLAHELRAVRPEVPVLMLTGYIRAEDELAAQQAGVRELLLKPTTMDELAQVLDTCLRK